MHYPTIFLDFATIMFDVGKGAKVNLGQMIFELIAGFRNGKKPGQKASFSFLNLWCAHKA